MLVIRQLLPKAMYAGHGVPPHPLIAVIAVIYCFLIETQMEQGF